MIMIIIIIIIIIIVIFFFFLVIDSANFNKRLLELECTGQVKLDVCVERSQKFQVERPLEVQFIQFSYGFGIKIDGRHSNTIFIHQNDSSQTTKEKRKTKQRTQYTKYSNIHAYIT